MRLLLISNSTNAGEAYLEYPMKHIKEFLGKHTCRCLFIPYAGVNISFDDYALRVKKRFEEIGQVIDPIHQFPDPVKAINDADVIVAGGGNTFRLIKLIQENKLIDITRERVFSGTPFIGWSAGANVACPTIRTTNDMPIVEPQSFNAFDLVPFQINPHYLDVNPEGHAGETREARIEEFIEINRNMYVVGLREGTMLKIENKNIELIGKRNARIFRFGIKPIEISPGEDLKFLLQSVPAGK